MRSALTVDCPAHEPHPVLLQQLTQLAAASVAPAGKPWWHRLTAKTGAAVVAGALLISGATADAEHAVRTRPTPRAANPAGRSAPRHVARHPSRPAPLADSDADGTSFGRSQSSHPSHRFDGQGGRHRDSVKKQNHQGGKAELNSESLEMSVPLVPTPLPQASLQASSNLLSGPHSRAHASQRSKSHR